ncbi:MAG TPA: hypothetical protein VHF01_17865 [Candidatus Acidoferrum sp.]|nr:hypothetical protein [Candidatus Acidoferrum sp.]
MDRAFTMNERLPTPDEKKEPAPSWVWLALAVIVALIFYGYWTGVIRHEWGGASSPGGDGSGRSWKEWNPHA